MDKKWLLHGPGRAAIREGVGVLPTPSFGLITAAEDGSVGTTYTLDASWTGVTWYRLSPAAPYTATAIGGSSGLTYVSQAADIGYRLMAVGTDTGVRKAAKSYQIVLALPVLLDAYDGVSGYTWTGATLTNDTSNKVQGTGSMVLSDTGAQLRASKSIGTQPAPLTWDTVAVWNDSGSSPEYANRGPVQVLFANTSSISGSNGLGSLSDGSSNYKRFGKNWGAQHVTENSNVSGLGAGTKWMATAPQILPYGATVKVDAAVRNAKGIPTVCLTYDDGFLSQYQDIYPALVSRGIKGSIMVPWSMIGLSGSRISGRMLIEELREMYDANVMAMCLDGTGDDLIMTTLANPAACVTELNAGKQWLVDNGLSAGALGWGWKSFCYPNGETDDNATRYQAAAMTGDGSTTVTVGSALASVTTGMTVSGYGVPANTTVMTVNSSTSFVLSNSIPAQTKPAAFQSRAGAFATGKLQTALKAAGYKIGRTTTTGQEFTRFGFDADQGLMMNGNTTTAQTSAQMIAVVDLALLRGTTALVLTHTYDGTRDDAFYDYLQTKQNAGLLQVLTLPELLARDGGASFPSLAT